MTYFQTLLRVIPTLVETTWLIRGNGGNSIGELKWTAFYESSREANSSQWKFKQVGFGPTTQKAQTFMEIVLEGAWDVKGEAIGLDRSMSPPPPTNTNFEGHVDKRSHRLGNPKVNLSLSLRVLCVKLNSDPTKILNINYTHIYINRCTNTHTHIYVYACIWFSMAHTHANYSSSKLFPFSRWSMVRHPMQWVTLGCPCKSVN